MTQVTRKAKVRGLVQLPNDVKSVGYRQVRPYHWEQVFHSEQHDFIGTQEEFIRKGLAYEYKQTTKSTREVIQ